MTVRKVYQAALALMGDNEREAADYEPQVVPLVNMMLIELFDANNSVREQAGLERLTEIPQAQELNDDVAYDLRIAGGVLPYGLAAKLSLEDSPGKASYFNGEYMERRAQHAKAVWADQE